VINLSKTLSSIRVCTDIDIDFDSMFLMSKKWTLKLNLMSMFFKISTLNSIQCFQCFNVDFNVSMLISMFQCFKFYKDYEGKKQQNFEVDDYFNLWKNNNSFTPALQWIFKMPVLIWKSKTRVSKIWVKIHYEIIFIGIYRLRVTKVSARHFVKTYNQIRL